MRLFLYLLPFCLAAVAAPAPAGSTNDNDDPDCEEWDGDIIENKDAATADGSAGIGVEFETLMFKLTSPDCPQDTVNNAKKKILAGRKQEVDEGKVPLWMLTADTGAGEKTLQAEYIIDGQQIKLGSGQAETVAKEIVKDFINWQPWKKRTGKDRVKIEVEDTPCDFYIDAPGPKDDATNIFWQPQSPPLCRLRLLSLEIPPRSPLGAQALVNKNYFKKKPNGIDPVSLTDDTVAFLSLVLTYAKTIAKDPLKQDESVKLRSVFMPRTDFHTLYTQVKSQLPGDLWNIINTISCYTPIDPKDKKATELNPNSAFYVKLRKKNDKITFVPRTTLGDAKFGSTTIKDWIKNLDKEDLLTRFDKEIDGSVGGLGSKMEKVLGTSRDAPLFEFRDLEWQATPSIASFVKDADAKLTQLHQKYRQVPTSGN
ncbi:hypothetical protein N7481_008442 [Penicillium waksmanii]|uniref:uncharacterized protein n=1 Tax=Penicillium waksmanii TaxID=69791 RepID=UPI002548DB77|nr:uncharacterized protein N7481_008442 [Penicillium waksmanii]KAJ5981144.1 hypothetical protein N7481_008442 [Penicillium waksmanii]